MSAPANKVERLALAAAVAPVLRRQTESAKARRVKVYSQETGEVVTEATLAEVQAGILATARIELDTAEGVKDTHRECALCGVPFSLCGKNGMTKACDRCRLGQTVCAGDGCDAAPPKREMAPSKIARRRGALWKCKACRFKDPEFRARRAEASRRITQDPEYRAKMSEAARRRYEDPSFRAKQKDAAMLSATNQEYRARLSESIRRKFEDPEYRATVAENNRLRAQEPEWRTKNAEMLRRMSQDPEWRAKQTEAVRRRANDPEWHEKAVEILRLAREAKRTKAVTND